MTRLNVCLYQVSAVDSDLGSNGDIAYNILDGEGQPASQFFQVAEDTGIITVRDSVAHLGKIYSVIL